MRVIKEMLSDIESKTFDLGFVGEKNHTCVMINCVSLFNQYPDAVATMVARPPVGDIYPVVLHRDGVFVVWNISESDIANAGSGQYQLTFTDGEGDNAEIIKTLYGSFSVKPSMVSNGEPPEPIEDWLEEANEALAEFGKINELSASATTLPAGQQATAEITNVNGHKNIAIGIPKGDKGDKGDDGDPAPAEDVTAAVDAYLEENFSNPSNPPLDRSLSSSSSAAPADLVGDLKSAIGNLYNISDIGVDKAWQDTASTKKTTVFIPIEHKKYIAYCYNYDYFEGIAFVAVSNRGSAVNLGFVTATSYLTEIDLTNISTAGTLAIQFEKTGGVSADAVKNVMLLTLSEEFSIAKNIIGLNEDTKAINEGKEDKSEVNARIIPDGVGFSGKQLQEISNENKKYISTSGIVSSVDSVVYSVHKFSVTPGKAYNVTASYRSSTSAAYYAFYDSSNNVVKVGTLSNNYGSVTTSVIIDESVVAPKNASYMLVEQYSGSVSAAVKENLPISEAIDLKVNEIKYVDGIYKDITSEFTLTNGYIQKSDGAFISYETAESTGFIDIDEYPHLFVSGSPLYSSNALYAIYTETEEFIASYRNNALEHDYDFSRDAILQSYPTAKFVRFSSIFSGSGFHLIIKRNTYVNESISNIAEYIKPWADKKWACIGDSLTEVNSRTTKHYFDYVKEKTGITVVNLGESGAGYKNPSSTNSHTFYDKVTSVPTDSDVVTIFGSGNDLTHGYTLGDITDTGTTTICGCINKTLDDLIAKFIDADKVPIIGVITPTPWIGHDPGDSTDSMSEYSEKIIAICKGKSIPVLDLYHCSLLFPNNSDFRAFAYSKDEGNGVHPDETGHRIIAPRFQAFLDSLLIH